MAPLSKTAPSTPRLSEYARHFVFPEGITRTVWPRVEAKGRELGLGFDWWQSQLGTVCLGYGEDGRYVATVGGVGMSIPRQVGKTYFVLALLVVMCILFPGLQVVWTAHHLRTSTKTFTALRGICRRRKVAPHIRALRSANGEQQAEFVNGSMIMFGSRKMGFGRGFDEVDIEVFDEAQILDTKSLEDMIAATNQARHEHGALLFFMGTPPRPTDPSEAFTARREEALAAKRDGEPLEDAVWLEVGAEPGSDTNDRSQWARMNPSYPKRTPKESLLRLRKNLKDDDSWNREGRGIWDEATKGGVIPPQAWRDAADAESVPVDRWALGVEVAPDLAWASLSIAGLRADGSWHIALEACRETHGEGVEWLPEYVSQLVALNPQIRGVVVDSTGPVKSLLERRGTGQRLTLAFVGTKVKVNAIRVSDLGASCASLLSGLSTEDIRHMGQAPLTTAALAAGKRDLADTGMWTWRRRAATSDITPIQAATLALHGAQATKLIRPGGTAGTGRRVVTG